MHDQNTNQNRILADLAEKEVMAAVQADVSGAFEELVRLYQKRAYQVIHQMVGSREEAEDLTQELFLRVFKARKSYRPECLLSTWIFTIAHNLAVNQIRNRHRNKAFGSQNLPLPGNSSQLGVLELNAISAEGTPSARMRSVELSQIVQEAIQTLSADQRLAIVLNKFEEMSYQQISQVMGRSEPAVKSILTRARANLKNQLEAYLESGLRPSSSASSLKSDVSDCNLP